MSSSTFSVPLLVHLAFVRNYILNETNQLTKRFFSATKTLGAETTATTSSPVAPSSSSLARSVAVSSEYYKVS